MSGITVGPRQFNFQIPGQVLAGSSNNNNTNTPYRAIAIITSGAGYSYYMEQKLDLRGMNAGSADSRGMNPLSVQLQESKPWFTTNVGQGYEGAPTFMVYDMITTVPLNEITLANMFSYPQAATSSVQGFLPDSDQPTALTDLKTQVLNTSQVIWGRWRQMTSSREFAQGTDKFGVRWGQSGTWGSGEVMVSNDAYYTRLIITENDNQNVICPSANIAVWAEVIALSEGQELTQLSRMVQR